MNTEQCERGLRPIWSYSLVIHDNRSVPIALSKLGVIYSQPLAEKRPSSRNSHRWLVEGLIPKTMVKSKLKCSQAFKSLKECLYQQYFD